MHANEAACCLNAMVSLHATKLSVLAIYFLCIQDDACEDDVMGTLEHCELMGAS